MRLQPVLGRLTLGPVLRHENLSFVAVLGRAAVPNDLLLPDEALNTGYFTVTDSGRIDTLFVENRLGVKVFVPSGATFEGETQSRAAVFAVVIAPRASGVPLLVRCVEQGQPLSAGERLSRSDAVLLASARTGDVSQEGVWETIAGTIRSAGSFNPTGDYPAGLRECDLEGYLAAVGPPAPGQRGYLAAVRDAEGVSFYADILGSHELYARLHPRLWKSVAAVARSNGGPPAEIEKSELSSFLTEASEMELDEKRLRTGLIGVVLVGGGATAVSALVNDGIPIQISLRKEHRRNRAGESRDATLFPSVEDFLRMSEESDGDS